MRHRQDQVEEEEEEEDKEQEAMVDQVEHEVAEEEKEEEAPVDQVEHEVEEEEKERRQRLIRSSNWVRTIGRWHRWQLSQLCEVPRLSDAETEAATTAVGIPP